MDDMVDRSEAWGHVVAKLIAELPGDEEIPADVRDKARILDADYGIDPVSHAAVFYEPPPPG